mgnify:CR=1 FL=1
MITIRFTAQTKILKKVHMPDIPEWQEGMCEFVFNPSTGFKCRETAMQPVEVTYRFKVKAKWLLSTVLQKLCGTHVQFVTSPLGEIAGVVQAKTIG